MCLKTIEQGTCNVFWEHLYSERS